MKMEKSVIFVKKYLKIKIWKLKKYHKVLDNCHCKGEYWGAGHSVCNFKYSVPTKIRIVVHNECSYEYHFITKWVSRKI